MRHRARLVALGVLALGLGGCGQPVPPGPIGDAAPQTTLPAPGIGDTDPTDWHGNGPDRHPVHGIDTSRFQTTIDWPTARAAGVSFAWLKATEGGDRLDPAFTANWRAAARAGVPRGAYHFFYFCRPAVEQARWFIAHVPRVTGALPPVLDIEWTPFSPTCTLRPNAATVRAEAEAFMTTLERHYGQRPLIYTTVDFFRDNQMWRLAGHEFWLRSVAAHPAETFAGQHWTFWQYSGTGLVPGIAGEVDLNVFSGSQTEWSDWLAQRRQ
ncbi:MAG: GH25 family lysozyme [Pseudorhodobacter sp.]|nr:GH25 family lysozyme [Pseudorhodobacter sp.]